LGWLAKSANYHVADVRFTRGIGKSGLSGQDNVANVRSLANLVSMSRYTVAHAGRENNEPFSCYLYEVFRDGRKVAELRHDYRGDEHWLRLLGGSWVTLPERILEGGGPHPLALSKSGTRALDQMTG